MQKSMILLLSPLPLAYLGFTLGYGAPMYLVMYVDSILHAPLPVSDVILPSLQILHLVAQNAQQIWKRTPDKSGDGSHFVKMSRDDLLFLGPDISDHYDWAWGNYVY